MAKTRRNRAHRTPKSYTDNHLAATMHGLTEWYTEKFEKLGWMILAKSKGHDDKISSYKTSLDRLKHAIELKMKNVTEHDRKVDLEIMHHNVCILMDHVNKDF